jgi:DeoR/GlpR family transcriptional regulator of sugar metabolism
VSPNPRQVLLLQAVQAQGSVMLDQLADTLAVTLQTVRRDVQRLADEGLLTRFHGGVRVPSSTTENIAHQQRTTLNAEGKARIARAVAQEVPNGCSLILNIGTTTEAIAQALLQHTGLRVITNNLNVAIILSANPHCEVIVAGGVLRGRDRGVVGEGAIDFIRQFKVDIALVGISCPRGLAGGRPQQVQPARDGRGGHAGAHRPPVHRRARARALPNAVARRSGALPYFMNTPICALRALSPPRRGCRQRPGEAVPRRPLAWLAPRLSISLRDAS